MHLKRSKVIKVIIIYIYKEFKHDNYTDSITI